MESTIPMQAITKNINVRVGVLRVYVAVQVCWLIGGAILYLLDWPGEWRHDPEAQPWIERAGNIDACQSRARSYQSEHDLSNLARQFRNAAPEVPNFGRDERGLQITTLTDALRECEQRYPVPKVTSGFVAFLGGGFRAIRHDPLPLLLGCRLRQSFSSRQHSRIYCSGDSLGSSFRHSDG